MDIPKYFFQKKLLFSSIIFIVAFSVLYMTIYKPFSPTVWFDFWPLQKLLITISFYLAAIAILFISKYLLYIYQTKNDVSLSLFIMWVAGEFVLIATTYLIFTNVFEYDHNVISLSLILKTALCVGFILAIPYTIVALYVAYHKKKNDYNDLLRQWQSKHKEQEHKLLNLCDYNNFTKLSVSENAILYMESQDNYVQIFYEMDGKLQSSLLRVSTQKLEEQLAGTSLVRCHRSYIVNIDRIKLFKDKHGYATIILEGYDSIHIPVSKSYYKTIFNIISGKEDQV